MRSGSCKAQENELNSLKQKLEARESATPE
jgi:hypothetical protein